MNTQKERLLQRASEYFTQAKKARPDKMTEKRFQEKSGQAFTQAVKGKK